MEEEFSVLSRGKFNKEKINKGSLITSDNRNKLFVSKMNEDVDNEENIEEDLKDKDNSENEEYEGDKNEKDILLKNKNKNTKNYDIITSEEEVDDKDFFNSVSDNKNENHDNLIISKKEFLKNQKEFNIEKKTEKSSKINKKNLSREIVDNNGISSKSYSEKNFDEISQKKSKINFLIGDNKNDKYLENQNQVEFLKSRFQKNHLIKIEVNKTIKTTKI